MSILLSIIVPCMTTNLMFNYTNPFAYEPGVNSTSSQISSLLYHLITSIHPLITRVLIHSQNYVVVIS